MYHFIYETTNKINGKKYIGKHSTDNIDDGYLGSGIVLLKAIKKYGRDHFERQIIEMCDSEDALIELEKKYITENIIESELYYNIALGGYGGKIVLYPEHPLYEEICNKMSEINSSEQRRKQNQQYAKENHKKKTVGMYGKKQSDYQKQVVSSIHKGSTHTREHIEKQKETYRKTIDDPNYTHPNKGRKFDEEHTKKMSEIIKNRPKKTCPYCGKTMNAGNYARYHGDKCKDKE